MSQRLIDYLLGELSGSELAALEQQLAVDADLAAELERLRPVVDRLESLDPDAWELPPAPPLAGPLRSLPDTRPRHTGGVAGRPLAMAALAVVLLALGVAIGLLATGGDDDTAPGRVLALEPVEPLGGSSSGDVTIAPDRATATINLRDVAPSPQGEFYELWLLNSPTDLVSLGSFKVPASGEAEVTVPLPADPDDFAAIDLSLEPADGDPAHSSLSVLRAPIGRS